MTTILLCVSAGEVFKWIGYIIVAMICFMFMIVVHELGHYTAGKILGFKINEFAIGFGPAIFKTTTNKQTGEVFSVRCIPAGGFCAFEGEDEEASSPDSFNSHPVWKRIIVLAAGVFFNFVSALITLNIFFMAYGEAAPVIVDTYEFVDSEHVQTFEQGENGGESRDKNGEELYKNMKIKSFFHVCSPFVSWHKYIIKRENCQQGVETFVRLGNRRKNILCKTDNF